MRKENLAIRTRRLSDVVESISVVTPMANEEVSAARFVAAVLSELQGIPSVQLFVVLDGASIDATRRIVDELAEANNRLTVVWAPENRSVVDAYLRGYSEALQSDADWILEIDAGFSHRPEDIPLFLEKADEGYDCVFGTRFALGGTVKNAPMSRRLLSRGGTALSNAMLGTRLSDMTSGFQLFHRDALTTILDHGIQSRGPFFQTEMKTYARSLRVAEVPIQYSSPSHAVSTDSVKDALSNLWHLRKRVRREYQTD